MAMNKLNIRKIREIKGFSQAYMAEKLGVSQAGYYKMERDILGVTLEKLVKISKILEFDLCEIILKEIGNKK
jgi:transcriptional regulator with XRE-family HTH domain